MKRLLLSIIITILPLLSFAQLLKGKFVGVDVKEITIEYSPEGNEGETQYIDTPVKDGVFTFDIDLPIGTVDIGVVVPQRNALGAHLTKGKTLEMTISEKDDRLVAEFKGEGCDISKVVCRMNEAYDIMRYFSMDEDAKTSYGKYRTLLDSEYKAVKSLVKGIKNKKNRKFYSLLNEGTYKERILRLIRNKANEEGKEPDEYTEYAEILKNVDINSDIDFVSGLANAKFLSMTTVEQGFKCDMEPYCTDLMQLAKLYVTNPKMRRSVVNTVGYCYFTLGDDSGDYHAFLEKYKRFAGKENADIPQKYESIVAAWDKTHSGAPAPDITLTDKDGNTILLSSLKGKFTYIDVWATWCGPCKEEIPFMVKLVERFKGNDKVQFISISVDENINAWKKMIAADKPQWAQYNIHGETSKKFMSDWRIQGIPRFIMIDKDGNIFSADASRPSEEETAQTIIEQTK